MAENEEELKNLLMKVKEKSEKAGLKLKIQKRHLDQKKVGTRMVKGTKAWGGY